MGQLLNYFNVQKPTKFKQSKFFKCEKIEIRGFFAFKSFEKETNDILHRH